MSTHNICFHREIRKISAFLDEKNALSIAMVLHENICCGYSLFEDMFPFFFFLFGFYGPFKNTSLISSRSFIKGGRKPKNPDKTHLTICKQNLVSPHVTRARPKQR